MSEDEFDDPIVSKVHRHYKEARSHSADWRDDAKENYDFDAGLQWTEEDLRKNEDNDRPSVVFNRISRTVNAIIGTQINNRQETRFIPREMGDVQVNEILTSTADWVRDEADAEDEETDAFTDLIICGMGWTETRIDYDEEPDGKILVPRIDPLWMFWDPKARRHNLADRRWNMLIKQIDKDEFENRWPDADVEASSMPWDEVEEDDWGLATHTYPQDAYKENSAEAGKPKNNIRVAQYQWWDWEDVYRVGQNAVQFTKAEFDKLKGKLEERGIPHVKQRAKVYRQAFVAGKTLLEEELLAPSSEKGDRVGDFTFQVMTGKRDRNRNVWLGLVQVMKDPQRWGNKFFSQILDILNKASKGGVIAEKSAFDDPREVEEKWARPDSVIWARDGAIRNQQIIPKPLGDFPSSMDKLMSFSLESVHEVTGVNLETLGLANREQPGVLEMQRKKAGLTLLSIYFDALKRYRKTQGRVLLYFIRSYISDGRLVKVLGKDGNSQFIPLMRNPDVAQYDVIVDESPSSPNQRETTFAALAQLIPTLVKGGIPMPPQLLDYAPIPSSLANDWKKHIESSGQMPDEVRQQVEQMQQQVQKLSEENGQLKDKRQETEANLGLKRADTESKHNERMEEFGLKEKEARAELELTRYKMEETLAIQREKMEGELELKLAQAEADFGLEEQKMAAESGAKQEDTKAAISEALSKINVSQPNRKINFKRNADGFIESAEVDGSEFQIVNGGKDG